LIFLRIQKTAGTSFEKVVGEECTAKKINCEWYWHLDWRFAIARAAEPQGSPRKIIVTWLRDPVERIASEYQYLLGVPADVQTQWDYPPRLHLILELWRNAKAIGIPPVSLADFSMLPGNPANNRQTLYLLGFDRPHISACNPGGRNCTDRGKSCS